MLCRNLRKHTSNCLAQMRLDKLMGLYGCSELKLVLEIKSNISGTSSGFKASVNF